MKNAFIRIMAVGVLTTSISAFAMSENAKASEDKNSGGTNVGTAMESNVSLALDELQGKYSSWRLGTRKVKRIKRPGRTTRTKR